MKRETLIPKKEQTIEWATEVLTNRHKTIYLEDISKKLWTKELVELAVLNGKASLSVVPLEERTYELCMAAMVMKKASWSDVPKDILTHEFLVDMVKRSPKLYGMAAYLDKRLMANALGLPEGAAAYDAYLQSKEAVELALAQLCPEHYGRTLLSTHDWFLNASEEEKNQLIVKELGAADRVDAGLLYRALKTLLSTFPENGENSCKKSEGTV